MGVAKGGVLGVARSAVVSHQTLRSLLSPILSAFSLSPSVSSSSPVVVVWVSSFSGHSQRSAPSFSHSSSLLTSPQSLVALYVIPLVSPQPPITERLL